MCHVTRGDVDTLAGRLAWQHIKLEVSHLLNGTDRNESLAAKIEEERGDSTSFQSVWKKRNKIKYFQLFKGDIENDWVYVCV